MKSVSFLICGLALILFFVYSGNNEILSFQKSTCSEPLTYRIGKIDSRFNISEEEVKKSLDEASGAWSEVVNKPVAEYSEQGDISVELVYDTRQQLMDEELSFRKKLSTKEQQISNEESVYNGLVENFERKLNAYKIQEEGFRNQLNIFNEWVEEKNKKGGFRENEVPEYKRKQADITFLKEQLDREKNQLNRLEEQLNRRVDNLNKSIDEKNALFEEYNQKYSGKKNFTQGMYEVKGNSRKIKVYQFVDAAELRLVLAHELGHALGIQHVANPEAVMFDHTRNQSKTRLKLAEDDVEAIMSVCNPA